jgi:hypothetical protein
MTPRFAVGDRVVLSGGDYKSLFPEEVFSVRSSAVFLDKPGLMDWEEGKPVQHIVPYVLEAESDHRRITFVTEQDLTFLEEREPLA